MKKYYKIGMVILGFVLLVIAYRYRSHRLQEDIAERILRFHVVANSNTEQDQTLKLKVRDRIGEYLREELADVQDLEECEKIVSGLLAQIEHCASEVITGEGYSYPVKAVIKDTKFPVKTYGSYSFPAGTYRALNVVIGSGAGENWWCVMYPNLCFANAVYRVEDENSKEELQSVLTEDEYKELMAEGKIRVKFKYLDFIF